MSARDSDRDLDDLLRDDGGEVGALYKRLPRYEPPRRLDRAVLGEAARVVHSGKPPRRQRWIVGVGSAAGIVLAAGIAWRIGHDPLGSGATPAAAPIVVPVQPISEPARAKHAASAPSDDRASNDTAATSASAPSAAEAPPPAQRAEALPQRKPRARAGVAASSPAAPPAPPPPTTPPPRQATRDIAEHREKAASPDDARAGAGARASTSGAQPFASGGIERESPAAPSKIAPALSAPSGSVELQRDTQLAPQDWLAHIGQLARQGRTQQAAESLRLFRRAHPDWVVPDELAPLLK